MTRGSLIALLLFEIGLLDHSARRAVALVLSLSQVRYGHALRFFRDADAGRHAIVEAGLCEVGQSLVHDISCTIIQLHVNSCCGILVTAQFLFSVYSTYADEILKPDESGRIQSNC